MSKPSISIIIPCYNQAHFLGDCIGSLVSQNFPKWEAIIVNDGSTDRTADLAEEFSQKDPRIQSFSQTNQGLSAARNAGLYLAKGEYLLFLDGDDWLEPDCLQTFFEATLANSRLSLFRAGYAYWDRLGGTKFHEHLPFTNGPIYPQVLTANIGPCHSILIRRDLACKVGEFDTTLKSCEDWDFWMRAGRLGAEIYSIPKVLVAYRYVLTSMSRHPRVMYKSLSEVTRRAGKVDSRLPKYAPYNNEYDLDYPEIQKNHLIRMLGVMLHQEKVEEAITCYQEELKKCNWKLKKEDWKLLSSYLSWGYFFAPSEIKQLLHKTKKDLCSFFVGLGYSNNESNEIIRMVFEHQLKKRNHQRFGKYFGALLNRLEIY
ncbi:glycosyltransferase family 2 protein [Algoriphagus namhaensis]